MTFVQVASEANSHVHGDNCQHDHEPAAAPAEPTAEAPKIIAEEETKAEEKKDEGDDTKKRFTKSYGS
jgi:hypothetical protein